MSGPAIVLKSRVNLAIGLMSGTSHDGVSAALVRIAPDARSPLAETFSIKLIAFKTYPYPARLRERLMRAASGVPIGAGEISSLNFEVGRALAQAAFKLARGARVDTARLGFIGSHGHTFFHMPPSRSRRDDTPSTLQLGEPAVIAALTGAAVVSDFRPMDMALGGEAAPLAPLAHRRLFGCSDRGRVVQNIGGIGNATYLPPAAAANDPRFIAFDTGPGNMLIDLLATRLTAGRLRMDRDGRMARRGLVHEPLVDELMRESYFRLKPPKSTGREEFGVDLLNRAERRARSFGLSCGDLIASLTALTARSIADAISRFIAPLGPIAEIIVTGGGARNPVLMAMLRRELPNFAVMRAEDLGLQGDAIEAIAFAILGYEMLLGRPGNIPAATGASRPAVLGKLTMPPGPAVDYRSGSNGNHKTRPRR